MLRRRFAEELAYCAVGDAEDNSELGSSEYVSKLRETVARGEVLADHYLAMNPIEGAEEIEGIDTMEPGLQHSGQVDYRRQVRARRWADIRYRPAFGDYDTSFEVMRKHAHEMLGRRS